MRRRSVITGGLAALLLAPGPAYAQQPPAKIPRVGILSMADNEGAPMFEAFRAGLRDLGYIEGRNIILEFRFARGNRSRIPIVSPVMMNPVELGLVASLARPGGNITGFTLMHTELNGKRLELLHTTFPLISAVAALVNPPALGQQLAFEQTETAARLLGLGDVRRVEAASATALRALRPDAFSGAGGVVVIPDGLFYDYHRDVVALVNEARLPAIYPEREYADDGGLMAYGANVADNFRRAAGYVDRILKGTKPGDLPIQEPVKFDFVVNLKTARELGLTIPPLILAGATEVIE